MNDQMIERIFQKHVPQLNMLAKAALSMFVENRSFPWKILWFYGGECDTRAELGEALYVALGVKGSDRLKMPASTFKDLLLLKIASKLNAYDEIVENVPVIILTDLEEIGNLPSVCEELTHVIDRVQSLGHRVVLISESVKEFDSIYRYFKTSDTTLIFDLW